MRLKETWFKEAYLKVRNRLLRIRQFLVVLSVPMIILFFLGKIKYILIPERYGYFWKFLALNFVIIIIVILRSFSSSELADLGITKVVLLFFSFVVLSHFWRAKMIRKHLQKVDEAAESLTNYHRLKSGLNEQQKSFFLKLILIGKHDYISFDSLRVNNAILKELAIIKNSKTYIYNNIILLNDHIVESYELKPKEVGRSKIMWRSNIETEYLKLYI